jgi:hypothetical protein
MEQDRLESDDSQRCTMGLPDTLLEKLKSTAFIMEGSGCVEQCIICLENLQGKRVIRLHCDHVYHVGCISEWLEQHYTCPVCRKCAYDSNRIQSPELNDDPLIFVFFQAVEEGQCIEPQILQSEEMYERECIELPHLPRWIRQLSLRCGAQLTTDEYITRSPILDLFLNPNYY